MAVKITYHCDTCGEELTYTKPQFVLRSYGENRFYFCSINCMKEHIEEFGYPSPIVKGAK